MEAQEKVSMMSQEQTHASDGNSGTDAATAKAQFKEIQATAGTTEAFLTMFMSFCQQYGYDFKELSMIRRAFFGAIYDIAFSVINKNK